MGSIINKSMKDILLGIINSDTSRNKSSTRYLYRSHPELWNRIIENTSFLPNDAKPKQRVWHILNEIYEIPKCPITGQFVKWWENRYLETLDVNAARIKQYRDGKAAIHHPDVKSKADESNRRTAAEGKRKSPTLTEELLKQRIKKLKQTCLEKYGADNPSKTKEVKEKIYQQAVARGCTPKEDRSLRRLYYDAVWKFTEQSWKQNFDLINPDRISRSKNALDHIYSIQQGFRESIPPYIIGHYTNLRVISLSENSIKGMRCDKTPNQLFDDFFNCVNQ